MKKLIITAHPSKDGFTHKIANSFERWAIENWDIVEILDLYDEKNTQDYLRFEDASKPEKDEKRNFMQKKILEADELVFVFPVWWSNMPAILKNFFDMNFQSGFAYKYEKKWPVWLLKWKTARVFSTCDAPSFFYTLFFLPMNLKGYFKMYLLGFCGIKLVSFDLFGKMRKKGEGDRDKILEKVYSIGLNG